MLLKPFALPDLTKIQSFYKKKPMNAGNDTMYHLGVELRESYATSDLVTTVAASLAPKQIWKLLLKQIFVFPKKKKGSLGIIRECFFGDHH